MDPIYLAFMLLFLGLALLVIEFFVPSGGMIGVIAGILILVSVWLAWKAWYRTNPTALYVFIGSIILLIPSTVVGTLWIMPRTKFGKKILLEAPKLEDVTPFGEEQARLQKLVGKTGNTMSMLNPGGMVTVDGERFHCESPGLILDPGTEVVVSKVNGNRLVVVPPLNESIDLALADSGPGDSTGSMATTSRADSSPANLKSGGEGSDSKEADAPTESEPSDDSVAPLDFEIP